MKLPVLKIRNLESRFPVIQAGMGIHIGSAALAAETVNLGGFGTIASVGLGDKEKGKYNMGRVNAEALRQEIDLAKRRCAGKKPLGVNIMTVLSDYQDFVQTSIEAKVDYIISGAGLPLKLPEYVGNADIALIPVISGGRALELILKIWSRKYNRLPDAVIVEGPRNGGHLGFSAEQLAHPETCSLEILLQEVKDVVKRYDCAGMPVIGAGEVACRRDIEKMLQTGYEGVQIGTHFICSEEAGIAKESKEVYVHAKPEDIVVIKSPVGLPVRVLKTPLVERVMAQKKENFTCYYHCLKSCNPEKSQFCIARALIATWSGDVEHGLYMCGMNVGKCTRIYPLKDFFATLEDD